MLARLAATVALVTLGLVGCDNAKGSSGARSEAEAAACAGAEREGGALHWFHDDYPRAMACARAKKAPLVIDMWAPWCHTCLSMQSYVLTDAKLADYDRRFVFLALDTDREANAAPVAKFPPAAWPTFFVISSVDESIQSRFVGAATVEQFAAFLDTGERGHMALGGKALPPADAHARAGDQAASTKDWVAADTAYTAALAASPQGWPRRADVMVSLIASKSRREDWEGCAATALLYLDQTGASASASDFSYHAIACAEKLAATRAETATTVREAVVKRLTALAADEQAPLSVDDRSDALMYLREALDALGRKDEAKVAAQRQRALLDAAAAKAPAPRVAMTYNWPRAEVYLYLGVVLELVPALEQSIKDLPEEYDPPARLAWVYLKGGKPELAVEWAEKAAKLAYGPRKTRVLATLADAEKARGNLEGEKAARRRIVETWESLPAEQRNAAAIEKAKADLAALDAPGAAAGSAAGSGATSGAAPGSGAAAGSGAAPLSGAAPGSGAAPAAKPAPAPAAKPAPTPAAKPAPAAKSAPTK